jgi:acyl-[acyl-carrier-protein]-phospholipid O-acyltransferase/long-chain-fatty-acid--[acyl-carrier-protein] ligase
VSILERTFGLLDIAVNDLMAIIFTSGTTGEPKGVMLSHENVGSNIDVASQLFQLRETDTVLGVLPFFHSYGFTGGLWLVLALPPRGVYHFSPLDAGTIGTLCERHRVTIMMAAPTFLRLYLRRCQPEQFQTLDMVVLGAEKMPPELAQAFQDKFGVRPFEAYGTTELSPMAAINVPALRSTEASRAAEKEGSVGRAIPGTSARIVDPDSNVERGPNEPGMLLIRGPNVMLGYLNKPEKTAEVIRDGWYVTGDIAKIDEEGFITIVDRASRFSKIGGEIVPHLKLEECLQFILADGSHQDELKAVVTAIPDPKQGERLVVLHTALAIPVDRILLRLSEMGLPNLWIPTSDSFVEVPEIPILATGKIDLKHIKEIALTKLNSV